MLGGCIVEIVRLGKSMAKWELTGLRPTWIEVEVEGLRCCGREVKDVQASYRDQVLAGGGRLVPGDEDKVWQAIKDAYPRFVIKHKKPGKPGVSIPAAWAFIRYLEKRMKNKGLVDSEVAKRRAAICSACSLRSSVLGCSVCKHALGLFVKPPETLDKQCPQACQACGCYLPLKVWVPREVLGPAEEFEFSAECWMRQEQ